MHPEHRARIPELACAYALEHLAGAAYGTIPEGLDLDAYWRTIPYAAGSPQIERLWGVCHRDPCLELHPPASRESVRANGNPLALLFTKSREVTIEVVTDTQAIRTSLSLAASAVPSCKIREARTIRLDSDRGRLEIAAVPPPPWATRFGWDRCGLFADCEVAGAIFPLRWIPPGEFTMGSPEDEPGRWSDEGPQHCVTIEQGFWLGETPVTQAQYAALTGQRPSFFEHAGNQAPVEQVSWQDCREFCQELTKALRRESPPAQTAPEPDEAFRLPTEAEWEYACRAGTTTALYTGPLTIKADYDGPELDPIAWYGGNSGVDYEGGYDSSGWKGKQYEHTHAGTHTVGQKAPNPWGLYDMLGNVWEWCEDVWREYEAAPADSDTRGDEGRLRVLRGGCWAFLARGCRCAYRLYWEPGLRGQSLGFRLVLAARDNRGIGPFF